MYYPPAIQESALASSEADTVSRATEVSQGNVTNAPTPFDKPAKDTENPGCQRNTRPLTRKHPRMW